MQQGPDWPEQGATTAPTSTAAPCRDSGPRQAVACPCGPAQTEPRQTEPERLAALEGAWWVLHTKARNEKRVSSALAQREVPHYLPLIRVSRSYAKSMHSFDLPLFPGYLFVRGDREACNVALRTNRVANVLPVRDPRRLEEELIQIGRAIESGSPVELYSTIHTGRPYRIVRGPMRDVVGVVVRRGRKTQMCLAVTILGQSAMVEVDAALLEPAD